MNLQQALTEGACSLTRSTHCRGSLQLLIYLGQSCEYKKDNAIRHEGYDFLDIGGFASVLAPCFKHESTSFSKESFYEIVMRETVLKQIILVLHFAYFQSFPAGTLSV